MLLFIGLAFLNGIINIINKMINLQAKLRLGTANGTLINYLEGTALSLILAAFLQGPDPADFSVFQRIPPVYLLGGVFGLISMVLVLKGMAKTRIVYSTVLILIGQLGAGFLIDSMAAGKLDPFKILGIAFVVLGVLLDRYLSNRSEKKRSDA